MLDGRFLTFVRPLLLHSHVSPKASPPRGTFFVAIRQAFRHFDARRKGKVSETDLSDGLRRLGLELTTRQERGLFRTMGKREACRAWFPSQESTAILVSSAANKPGCPPFKMEKQKYILLGLPRGTRAQERTL